MNEEIGKRVQLAREQSGLTQEQLAGKLELSAQFISTIERGINGPSLETVIKLCDILNISSDWLLRGQQSNQTAVTIAERLANLPKGQLAAADRLITDIVELVGMGNR